MGPRLGQAKSCLFAQWQRFCLARRMDGSRLRGSRQYAAQVAAAGSRQGHVDLLIYACGSDTVTEVLP